MSISNTNWNAILEEALSWDDLVQRSLRQPSELLFGRFRLNREINSGGHGRVLSVCKGKNTYYAIKVPLFIVDDETLGDRDVSREPIARLVDFVREIQLMKQFENNDAHIVQLLEYSCPDSTDDESLLNHLEQKPIWFTMPEYKWDLEKYLLENGGKLPWGDVVKIMTNMATALCALNEKGWIHRDLKPANILFNGNLDAKFGDLGITMDVFSQRSDGNPVVGSQDYMSDEQECGNFVNSEVQSWGVVAYRCLVGRPPFSEPDYERKRVNGKFPPVLSLVPECPSRLSSLVEECLNKRLLSFTVVLSELDAIQHGHGIATDIMGGAATSPVDSISLGNSVRTNCLRDDGLHRSGLLARIERSIIDSGPE